MVEKLLKGMFFKEIVDQVESRKGKTVVLRLEKKFGFPLKFSSFKDYPVENHLTLLKLAAEFLYGQADPKTYYEMGRLSFKTFAKSMIGKTLLKLYATDVRKAALAIKTLWGAVTNFGIREAYDMGKNKMKITIKKDPRPPEYIAGVLAGAINYFEATPEIETKVFGPEDYEFIIAWKEKSRS